MVMMNKLLDANIIALCLLASLLAAELIDACQESKQSSDKSKSDKSRVKRCFWSSATQLTECLTAHNNYRRQHNAPDLVWDDTLANFALERSTYIANSDGREFKHPPGLKYGENLFWSSNPETTCEYMVRGWYDEIGYYNFNSPGFTHGTGHFTQLIWRGTTKLGCAMVKSSGWRGGVYLTCNYDPPGNFIGRFEYNVFPKSGRRHLMKMNEKKRTVKKMVKKEKKPKKVKKIVKEVKDEGDYAGD